LASAPNLDEIMEYFTLTPFILPFSSSFPLSFIAARGRVVCKQAGLMEVGADSVTVHEADAATEMLRAGMSCLDTGTKAERLQTE